MSSFELLAQLYVLSDKLQNDGICNSAIEAITDAASNSQGETQRIVDASAVIKMYQGTLSDSPGRRCLVDLVIAVAHPALPDYRDWLEPYPEEFKTDVIWALLRERGVYKRKRLSVKQQWLKSATPKAETQQEEAGSKKG